MLMHTAMSEGNDIEPRVIDDDLTSVSLGPNVVVQHTKGSDGGRGNAIERRVIDDALTSVIPGSTDVLSRPVDSRM